MNAERPRSGLKGWVLVGKTTNLGKFNSMKIELGSEFWVEDHPNHLDLGEVFLSKIEEFQAKHGLREHFD